MRARGARGEATLSRMSLRRTTSNAPISGARQHGSMRRKSTRAAASELQGRVIRASRVSCPCTLTSLYANVSRYSPLKAPAPYASQLDWKASKNQETKPFAWSQRCYVELQINGSYAASRIYRRDVVWASCSYSKQIGRHIVCLERNDVMFSKSWLPTSCSP
jgi:hypothetical protein